MVPGSKLIVSVSDPSTTTNATSLETRPVPESNTGPKEPPPAESKLVPAGSVITTLSMKVPVPPLSKLILQKSLTLKLLAPVE